MVPLRLPMHPCPESSEDPCAEASVSNDPEAWLGKAGRHLSSSPVKPNRERTSVWTDVLVVRVDTQRPTSSDLLREKIAPSPTSGGSSEDNRSPNGDSRLRHFPDSFSLKELVRDINPPFPVLRCPGLSQPQLRKRDRVPIPNHRRAPCRCLVWRTPDHNNRP